MSLLAARVNGMESDHFTPANVRSYVNTVNRDPAGGYEKARKLLDTLIATRFELYGIQLMDAKARKTPMNAANWMKDASELLES